jgi:uncharacterized protein (TIGR00730 family)
MNICVFCSSSDAVPKKYFTAARNLGMEMAKNGYSLVYGGANRGLMSAIADSVKCGGGKVTGVIPRALKEYGIAKQGLDELIITEDIRQRKRLMELKSEAFIFLPGGVGTLEEAMEILTLKQLHYHKKPLVFLNVNGFYNKLITFFKLMEKENFIKKDLYKMFYVAKDEKEAVKYIKNYKPLKTKDKWF